MSTLVVTEEPSVEVLTTDEAKQHLRVTISDDDSLIGELITAAREQCESDTRRAFLQTTFRQTLDSFPYFTDTMLSQQSAYPPSAYYPAYATTLWNYSQMIKLFRSPLIEVQDIEYTDTDNVNQTLSPGSDFIVDADSEPPRIFPKAGQYWPPVLYVPNAVRINFKAGYGTDPSDVPKSLRVAVKLLLAHWYENREEASPTLLRGIPWGVDAILSRFRILDFAPTRG